MKRIAAILLTLCLALSLLPCMAFAAPDGWQAANGGWAYYQDGTPLKGVRWIEAEGARYIFDEVTGLLQTGDAEGDVLFNGNLYHINPQKNSADPKSCYAVRNYTRRRDAGVTYYDGDGITFVGWISAGEGRLMYQTLVPKENVPGAAKDIYIYVWRAQYIPAGRHPTTGAPISAGWYLFGDDGVLLCNARDYTVEGVTYTSDSDGRILSPVLNQPGEASGLRRPALSDVEGLPLTNQQIAEQFQAPNAAACRTILDATNGYRAEVGAAPLELDSKMCVAATVRAIEMAQAGLFSHTRPNGTSCFTIFEDCGWSTDRMYAMGENIAYNFGYADPDMQACIGWRNSPGHYRNMVDTEYRKLGVGKCIAQDGRIYYVQLFASDAPQ